MAAPAPERQEGHGHNLLTQKLGPLATWTWLLIITVVIGAYYLYQQHKQATSASSTTTAPGATANASQVPDIIMQDYPSTQVMTGIPAGSVPPAAPPPRPAPAPAPSPAPKPAPRPVAKKAAAMPKPPVAPIFNSTYRVQRGETLLEVARKFGISRVQLAHANGLGTGAGLRTGQTLRVPSPAPAGRPNKAL